MQDSRIKDKMTKKEDNKNNYSTEANITVLFVAQVTNEARAISAVALLHCDVPYLISKARPYSARDAFVQIGILKDDGWILAPKLQRELFAVWRTPLHDPLASECAASEGNQRDFRMGDKSIPSLGTTSEDNIHHTWRKTS